jgi:hypothetical protein
MKVADALPVEVWRELLKREPVERSTEVKPTLKETPAEMAQRLKKVKG